jgi:hypothetical protein
LGPLAIAMAACALMLGGAAVGVQLRRALPERHLDGNTKDIVRLGGGLVATITAVVLGLLINSSNSTFEGQRNEVRRLAADLILLDHLLEGYGPEARPIRVLLRRGVDQMVDLVWHQGAPESTPDLAPGSISAQIYAAIHALPAQNAGHRAIQTNAAQVALDIGRARLMMMQLAQAPLPVAIVAVLVFWLTALFASFSLFTPINPASTIVLVVIAVSASAALLLFLEMSHAFTGLVHIPQHTVSAILPPL